MKRRNFIGGLLALPFVGKLLAKESESFAPPIEEVIECLECHSNMDCPLGTVCRTVNGASRCEPVRTCDCECDPKPGRCIPTGSSYIEFSVPMASMAWEMKVHDYGAHNKRMRVFMNRMNGLQIGTHGEPGDVREMLRKIKRHRR